MGLIRHERAVDAAAIFVLHKASFPSDAEARLVDALRAAGRLSVSLVAEMESAVVGHIAFSPVTAAADRSGVGLAPIAVARRYRRRGIAAGLIRAGLAACRVGGFKWAVVLGDPEYYRRFGFRPAAEFGLNDQYSGGPAFQALELVPGSLPVSAGVVRYAPEFASLG